MSLLVGYLCQHFKNFNLYYHPSLMIAKITMKHWPPAKPEQAGVLHDKLHKIFQIIILNYLSRLIAHRLSMDAVQSRMSNDIQMSQSIQPTFHDPEKEKLNSISIF